MSFFISNAWAEDAAVTTAATAAQEPSFWLNLLPLGVIVVVYFLLIRPQSKRTKEHRNVLSSLTRGDEVVTTGGLAGRITEVGDNFLSLEIADKVVVKVQKQSVSNVLPKGSLKTN